jgi:hypothetical protein
MTRDYFASASVTYDSSFHLITRQASPSLYRTERISKWAWPVDGDFDRQPSSFHVVYGVGCLIGDKCSLAFDTNHEMCGWELEERTQMRRAENQISITLASDVTRFGHHKVSRWSVRGSGIPFVVFPDVGYRTKRKLVDIQLSLKPIIYSTGSPVRQETRRGTWYN